MRSRRVLGLLLVTAALWSGCCGYAPERLFREDIRTVYVEFFDNATFRREFEVGLTKAVVEEIKLRTPLLLAPRNEADSVLSGQLVEFPERTEVKSERDRILKTKVTAAVSFRWHDRLTGTDIVPERTIRESVRIVEALEESISDLVFEEAAQRIVEEMQEAW